MIPSRNPARAPLWRDINAALIRWQSIGFIISSIAGALLYDADALNRLAAWLGAEWQVDKSLALRLPVFFTLLTACGPWPPPS